MIGGFKNITVIKQQVGATLYLLLPVVAVPLILVNQRGSCMTVGNLPVYVAHELNKNKLLTKC